MGFLMIIRIQEHRPQPVQFFQALDVFEFCLPVKQIHYLMELFDLPLAFTAARLRMQDPDPKF